MSTARDCIWVSGFSLTAVARRYPMAIAITLGLLIVESLLTLALPLAIGFSIDGLLQDDHFGLVALAVLCVALLFVGAGRRFYDTRAYARIYQTLAGSLVKFQHDAGSATSRTNARVGLLWEVVGFFEDELPTLLGTLLALVGTVAILAYLDFFVFLTCVIACLLIVIIYALSSERILTYNREQNDVLERQVDVIGGSQASHVASHFRQLMKWNIKLSDLETLNFSCVWLVVATMLLVSIVLVANNAAITLGNKITSVMYVFEFIEVMFALPLFYQQWVRLQEITTRLSTANGSRAAPAVTIGN